MVSAVLEESIPRKIVPNYFQIRQVEEQEHFLIFTLPVWRPCFLTDRNDEHYWKRVTHGTYVRTSFQIGPVILDNRFIWCRGNQSSTCNYILWTHLKLDHLRNISVRLFWIWFVEVVCRKCEQTDRYTDGQRHTTDNHINTPITSRPVEVKIKKHNHKIMMIIIVIIMNEINKKK